MEHAQNPDPSFAGSGMERRLDHEGPARASAREAVTVAGGQDGQARPSASAGSHGAVEGKEERHDHVSPAPGSRPINGNGSAGAESYEQQHVHSVYESIAAHFSSTRYKPWPFVASFLAELPPGAVGLDVGCGNGKYLDVNRDVVILGSDRSANLARLARELKVVGAGEGEKNGSRSSGADVVGVADGLDLPFGGGRRRVDFVICIAVIHHLSTRERRVEGVKALLDCVTPRDGKVLVYVWALEQGGSRRGWDEGTADQDQLVPWVLKSKKPKKSKSDEVSKKGVVGNGDDTTGDGNTDATYQRYYHLYRKGELEEDVQAAGGAVLGSGYEKDNWWVIASPKEDEHKTSPPIISQ
ncbi:S-adenosyl-L-methionine-dependent methyltransferase [Jackrogersella minutella]|nr:S-adenosyl-L-methionine-dependent methyltransferase [Jackrogersella minutella]